MASQKNRLEYTNIFISYVLRQAIDVNVLLQTTYPSVSHLLNTLHIHH
jgi:hypothetical protein